MNVGSDYQIMPRSQMMCSLLFLDDCIWRKGIWRKGMGEQGEGDIAEDSTYFLPTDVDVVVSCICEAYIYEEGRCREKSSVDFSNGFG